ILIDGLRLRHLLIGDDFRFGAQRRGDFAMLSEAARQHRFGLERMDTVSDGGRRVSSSEVRAALAAADFERARELLGRPYFISGRVIHGRKLGRALGFPTLNLRIAHGRPALSGIFVVRVHGLQPTPLPAVASLGVRPAVESAGRPLLEAHVFDFDRDVYGALVRVEFLEKLREEMAFGSMDALAAQIARDAEQARAHFRRAPQQSHRNSDDGR
ncbi:MAG TPA: riboflavin biosynthesis protein RibF, partial [Burkholderiaceae bacterium]|nr:riboflavin biosynthesis protein RibF [Burkholderiaceae bacterium]